MKITSFNPAIVTSDPDSCIKLFEELGFERQHRQTKEDVTFIRMKDANGFHIDIGNVGDGEKDQTVIRINVDDFDEAYEFLTARGFKNLLGEKIVDTGSSNVAPMVSPSGFTIGLIKHIKKEA